MLTLGRLQGVNTISFSNSIKEDLKKSGISDPSFSVLSLQEFEICLSLVERGVLFSEIMRNNEPQINNQAFSPYMKMLRQNAIPKIVAQRGNEVLDVITKQ